MIHKGPARTPSKAMALDVLEGDHFTRDLAILIAVWLLAMLVASLILIYFGNAFFG